MNTSSRLFPKAIGMLFSALAIFLLAAAICQPASAQNIDFARAQGRSMLKTVKEEIRKNYYDPQLHGMDMEAAFKKAEERIAQANNNGTIFAAIAQAVLELNDSHTFFIPPPRASRVEYGWRSQAIGDGCYITSVKPGSDAEAKGLKPGDRLLMIDQFKLNREDLWKIEYLYRTLRPAERVMLTVQSPGQPPRQLPIQSIVRQGKKVVDLTDDTKMDYWNMLREAEGEERLNPHRFMESGDDLIVWKMPDFDLTEQRVDDFMGKVRKKKALVLDLRDNPGGSIKALQKLAGYFFDQEVKIGDEKQRKDTKPLNTRTSGGRTFKGKVIVLIDSGSASCSELFARLIQIEKRGTVIGDKSSGAVMVSRHYSQQLGTDTVIPFSINVTIADLIMTDGKSLEHVGVTPDEMLLLKAEDLASEQDPVLSHAVELAGSKLSPEQAGEFCRVKWQKQ